MNTKVLVVLLLFLLISNQRINPQSKTKALPVIDISKNYPKKEIILQDIADIEYIGLETTNDVLLCGLSLSDVSVLSSVSDKYICTYEWKRGNIFVFDRKGKIVNHFNHRGQSGQEYPSISSMKAGVVFDEKNGEVFVCSKSIQVYSLSGKYKRTLDFNTMQIKSDVYNFDDETLLVYDDIIATARRLESNPKKNPYSLVSKKDGSIVGVLDIHLSKRYSTNIIKEVKNDNKGNITVNSAYIAFSNNMNYGRDFVISDISSDTMYLLTQNRELKPLLVRKPSVHASDPRVVWANELTTDKFILIGLHTLDFNSKSGQEKSKILMYEFETGEINEVSIRNADYAMREWSPRDSPHIAKNMTADMMVVPRIIEAYKKKQLKGEFEKFVAKLDEDDNPIVTVIKFK